MYKVGLKKISLNSIDHDVDQLLNSINYFPLKGKVLLKPNIVVAEPPENGSITHPRIIEAIAKYFLRKNIEVVIAEGTGIFAEHQGFEYLLRATRYAEVRDKLGIPIINLEKVERVKIPWRYGFIYLPKLLETYEYVNVPTMKTHCQATVTLGVKNQKGIISVKSKKLFHKKGLHPYILALSEIISPTLTVVDGIYCVEGNGPTGPPVGEVKIMNLLIAGTDMMAVDNVCVDVMGFDIREVEHLKPIDKAEIEIIGEKPDEVRSEFKKPIKGIRCIHPFVIHSDITTCTMCILSYYRAFSKIFNTPELRRELEEERPREIHIITGNADPPANLTDYDFFLGDCSKKKAQKAGITHISGCHPDYKDIVNHLFPGYYSYK